MSEKPFGKFRLLEQLGHGGMGIVYKAEQTDLGRTVALKALLHPEDKEILARFQREARAVARLRHPRIIPIHEIGEIEGRHYFTMDFIEGIDLDRLLDRGPVPARRSIEIVRDVARAVEYAHGQGIIHRDLKPSNILVDAEGQVFVTDFGLAKDLRSNHAKLTASGEVFGTPAYMAPEQVRGDRVGPACDVYALGAMLYHLLTGHLPFDGPNSAAVLLRVLHREPIPPRQFDAKIPRDAETMCLKALEKRTSRRYGSARELADDCDRFLRGEPILAHPVGRVTRLARGIARHPRAFAAVGAAFLAVGLWIGGSALRTRMAVRSDLAVAARLEREGKLAEANEAFRHALAIDPGNEAAWAGVRRIVSAEEEAHRQFEAGRSALDSAVLVLYDPAASWDEFERRVEHGRTLVERGLAAAPHLWIGHYLLGRAWELAGEEEKAERSWRESLARDPRSSPARYQLGRLLLLRAYQATLVYDGEDRSVHRAAAREILDEASREIAASLEGGSGLDDPLQKEIASILILLLRGDLASVRERARAELARNGGPGREDFHWLNGLASSGAEAIDAFTQALSIRPHHWPARFERGWRRIQSKEYEGAIQDFTQVLRFRPRFVEAYLSRGMCRQEKGERAAAISDFMEALRIDPAFVPAWHSRGLVRADHGDLDGALADYDEALRIEPHNCEVRISRSAARLRKGAWAEAIADCEFVLQTNPNEARAQYNRGKARHAQGDLKGAVRDYEGSLRSAPRFLPAHLDLAEAKNALEDFEGAAAAASRALEIDSNSATALVARGFARMKRSDFQGAIADFTACLHTRPETFAAYLFRAAARCDVGDLPGGIADYTEVLKRDPRSVAAYYNRGRARAGTGDVAAATQDLERAVELAGPGGRWGEEAKRELRRLKERHD